ncbi:MAG TPA: glycogen debranching N-terminal domain-containing protein, partial [Kribbella sp.]|uniref:glycogen debranching N-terminal domain-containing protein n=1 Tax=Kribbella sp. TaxID=1871183 RepID=UPI002D787754
MPYLHELVTAVAAPWVVLSPRSGQLSGTGAEGVYARDLRILSRLQVTIDGTAPAPLHVDEPAAWTTSYSAVVEGGGGSGHDTTVTLERVREVDGEGMSERITLVNRSRDTVEYELVVALGADLAGTAAVRSEAAADLPELEPVRVPDGLQWEDKGTRVSALFDPAPDQSQQDRVSWILKVEPGEQSTVSLRVTATFPATDGFKIEPPAERSSYSEVGVECDDARLQRWVRRSLDDVAGLQLVADRTGDRGERYLG